MADSGCSIKADICIPDSKISEIDFPQGNCKGEYEIDFPQGSNVHSSVKTVMAGLLLQGHQGPIYCATIIVI